MNQFHWQGSQPSTNKGAASSASTAISADLPAIKIQPGQTYTATVQSLSPQSTAVQTQAQTQPATQNQATNFATTQAALQTIKAQLQLSLPQANGKTVTVNQPLPQLPQGVNLNQQVQVALTLSKTGQLTVTLIPTPTTSTKTVASNNNRGSSQPSSQPSNQSATSAATQPLATNNSQAPQTVKLSLSDSQLVALLSLNKAYQHAKPTKTGARETPAANQTAIQVLAKITSPKGQQPQLQLPGLKTPIKLPENISSLLQGQKSIAVEVKHQGRDIELQLTLPKGGKVTTAITAEKLTPIIKQALNSSANQTIKIDNQPSGDKLTLANNQSLNLAGKASPLAKGDAQIKLVSLNNNQLTVQVSAKNQSTPSNITIDIPAGQINNSIKQALQSASKPLATSDGNTVQLEPDAPLITSSKTNPDLQIQKQALQQFIDPLIRLLLPKKQNWSEGLKTLSAIEQSLNTKTPNSQTATQNQATQAQNGKGNQINQTAANSAPPADLKQLLNLVKQAIPDHNSPLDERTINTMVTEVLNFSPTKTSPPSIQPTPANAIANALQLLLGAKVSQGEAKLSPQLQQQLQQLIKPLTVKTPATETGLKNITQGLVNNPSAEGSLKALTGIQSTIRHQQVENIEKRLDGNNQLEFNLPLRIDNQVKELHIAINEEKHNSETSTSRLSIWNLNLTFDLNEFGKLLVNAKLKDGEVSMHMYAEQPKTLALMNKFSATLEQRLEFHGVKINNIQSSLGKINPTNSKRQLNSLVQIKV